MDHTFRAQTYNIYRRIQLSLKRTKFRALAFIQSLMWRPWETFGKQVQSTRRLVLSLPEWSSFDSTGCKKHSSESSDDETPSYRDHVAHGSGRLRGGDSTLFKSIIQDTGRPEVDGRARWTKRCSNATDAVTHESGVRGSRHPQTIGVPVSDRCERRIRGSRTAWQQYFSSARAADRELKWLGRAIE